MTHEELMMVVRTAVAPLVLAFAICAGFGAILRRRVEPTEVGHWPAVVAVGAAMLAGQLWYFGLHIPANVRLVEGWQWVQVFAIISMLLLPVSSLRRPRGWLGDSIRFFLFVGFVFMAVRGLASMERKTAVLWMIGAPLICGIWATSLGIVGSRSARRLWPGILAVVCTISAITLFMLGSATHFFATASLAAALGGVFFCQPLLRRHRGLVAKAGGNFPLLLLAGYLLVHLLYVEDVPVHTLAILMAAPWGVLIRHVPGIRDRKPWVIGVVQFAVVLAILAAAFVPAWLHYEPDRYAGY